jgi:hypothetical protein
VRLFRRKRAEPVERLADDGTLTTVGKAPDDVETGDGAAVAAIASTTDLSKPVLLRHVLLVRDPGQAEALAAVVTEDGYDVRIDTQDGGLTWIVRANETALLTAVHVARARARLTSLASRHRGQYEGWEAAAP